MPLEGRKPWNFYVFKDMMLGLPPYLRHASCFFQYLIKCSVVTPVIRSFLDFHRLSRKFYLSLISTKDFSNKLSTRHQISIHHYHQTSESLRTIYEFLCFDFCFVKIYFRLKFFIRLFIRLSRYSITTRSVLRYRALWRLYTSSYSQKIFYEFLYIYIYIYSF